MKKKLSFVFSCKDDDYVKNFINRMEFCLNFNLEQISLINKLENIEFIIIDWGSKNKISEKFRVTNKKFKENIKFFYFNPEIAEKGNENLPGKFYQELAINCGIRRSSGSHILVGHHDTIFAKSSWDNIFRVIEDDHFNKFLFWVPRYDLNRGFVSKNPNIVEMQNYLDTIFLSKKNIEARTMQHGGGSAAIISKRNILTEKFGLSENLKIKGRFSGVDADIWQKISTSYDHLDSLSQGIVCHKLPVYSDSKKNLWLKLPDAKNRMKNFRYNLDYQNDSYGLKDINIESEFPKNYINQLRLNFNIKVKNNIFNLKNNFYYGFRNYYHTLLDNFNFKEIMKTRNVLEFFLKSRVLTYLSIGLPLKNRSAIISKNFNYLKIIFLIKHSLDNNEQVSSSLQKINRFFNRTHEGYYRFILEDRFKEISSNLNNLNESNHSTFVDIYLDQFTQEQIDIIFDLLVKNESKIVAISLNGYNKKNINNNFLLNFKKNDLGIYLNINFDQNVENGKVIFNYGLINKISYYSFSLLFIFLMYIRQIIYKINFNSRTIISKIKNFFKY